MRLDYASVRPPRSVSARPDRIFQVITAWDLSTNGHILLSTSSIPRVVDARIHILNHFALLKPSFCRLEASPISPLLSDPGSSCTRFLPMSTDRRIVTKELTTQSSHWRGDKQTLVRRTLSGLM